MRHSNNASSDTLEYNLIHTCSFVSKKKCNKSIQTTILLNSIKLFIVLLSFFNGFDSIAQINESFSDGNFTANPAWSGNTDSFQVTIPHTSGNGSLSGTSDGMVLGSLPNAVSSALFVESNQAYGQWSFSMAEGRGWSISSENYFSIILLSDSNNPEAYSGTPNFNGYFINFDGSENDCFTLYRQEGSLTSLILNTGFPEGDDGTSSIPRSFKITRTIDGLWSIFIDNEWDSDANILRGTIADNEITAGQYFGIVTKLGTPADTRVVWFDNLYIGDIIVDTTPPFVQSASALNDTTIVVTFNEPVLQSTALMLSNYTLENQGHPINASFLNNEKNQILLTFTESFPFSTHLTLYISNISDFANNIMIPGSILIFYAPPQPGDIVINELFFDQTPLYGLPNGDFLELYNRREYPISIENWILTVGTKEIVIPSFTIDALQYLIICPSSVSEEYSSYGNAIPLISTSDLTNTGKTITLADTANQLIHTLTYDISFYQDPNKEEGGWSIEQIDPNGWCQQKTNWRASVASVGGTPGMENSVNAINIDQTPPSLQNINILTQQTIKINYSEQVSSTALVLENYTISPSLSIVSIIATELGKSITINLENQILLDTEYTLTIQNIEDLCGNSISEPITENFNIKAVEEGDIVINEIFFDQTPVVGLPEWDYIELYNRKDYPISISNWELNIGTKEITIPTFTMNANQYLIIAPSSSYETLSEFGTVLPLIATTDLTNSGKTITLQDTAGLIVHTVSYNSSFYNDPEKEEGGWSIEQIDPDGWCQQKNNWRASIANIGGTPGSRNSIYATNIDIYPPEIDAVWIRNIRKINLLFSEEISIQTATNPQNYNLSDNLIIDFIEYDSISQKEITISLNSTFEEGKEYQITISNITDYCGNILQTTTKNIVYTQPYFGMLVFNEIMCNPTENSQLPNKKYIEIYNQSQNNVNLYQWEIRSGSTTYIIPSISIESDGYLILKEATTELIQENSPEISLFSSSFLSSTSKTLELYAHNNQLIHWVSYSNSWYNDEYKKLGGWSLEQIDATNFCAGAANWIASNASQGGTPGLVNSVVEEYRDNSIPEMLHLTVDSDTSISLHFNESLYFPELLNNTIWSIDQVSIPDNITVNSPTGTHITLMFNTPFERNRLYTLYAPTFHDCVGNNKTVEPQTFQIPETIINDQIIINEILFDPYSGGTEFVELYNKSNQIYAINNIYLSKFDSENNLDEMKKASEYGHLIYPNDYVILAKTRKQITEFYPYADGSKIIETQTIPSLPSSSGNIALINKEGEIIDKFQYDDEMHTPLLRNTRGVSLERINPNNTTQNSNNWHSASESDNYATPTYINSQYSELSINNAEFYLSSQIFSPDGDGYHDYLLINYKFDKEGYSINISIFDVYGRLTKNLTNNYLSGISGEIKWDGTNSNNQRVPIGPYVIYIESFNDKGEVNYTKQIVTVAYKK